VNLYQIHVRFKFVWKYSIKFKRLSGMVFIWLAKICNQLCQHIKVYPLTKKCFNLYCADINIFLCASQSNYQITSQIKCWFLGRENWSTWTKTSGSRVKHQRTVWESNLATLVEGQCSHQHATPAPLRKLTNHHHFPAMLFKKMFWKSTGVLNNQVYCKGWPMENFSLRIT